MSDSPLKRSRNVSNQRDKKEVELRPGWSESADLWLLKRLAAVEQHVAVWRLHKAVLYLSDRWVVKTVPRPGQGVMAESRVVTHVQITCVVLEEERDHLKPRAQKAWDWKVEKQTFYGNEDTSLDPHRVPISHLPLKADTIYCLWAKYIS